MGIPVSSNFDMNAALPLDSRTLVADLVARDAIGAGSRHEGLTVYVLATGKNYQLRGGVTNANWVESGSGGGVGGSAVLFSADTNAPMFNVVAGVRYWQFDSGLGQVMYAAVKVHSSFTGGTQVNLRLNFLSAATTGNVRFRTVATLIRPGTDLMTSTTNQHVSTNIAVNQGAGTAGKPQAVVCDLSTGDGKIGSTPVAISAGDLILVVLERLSSDTAPNSASFIESSSEVTFL